MLWRVWLACHFSRVYDGMGGMQVIDGSLLTRLLELEGESGRSLLGYIYEVIHADEAYVNAVRISSKKKK